MSCLDVQPAVNAALIKAAKDPRDGLIRIQTFSWVSFSTMVAGATTGTFQWQIPVSVTTDSGEQYELFEEQFQTSWTETLPYSNRWFTLECPLGQCG